MGSVKEVSRESNSRHSILGKNLPAMITRARTPAELHCSLDHNDEATTALCSLPMLTGPSDEVGPSPRWCCAELAKPRPPFLPPPPAPDNDTGYSLSRSLLLLALTSNMCTHRHASPSVVLAGTRRSSAKARHTARCRTTRRCAVHRSATS